MAEFMLKYADAQGAVHERVEDADSERALRDKYADQGVLIYSIRPRHSLGEMQALAQRRKGRLNLEQFLIFNQQFVTLIRAGLPILKSLELLQGNIKNKKLGRHIRSIHDAVKTGAPLSEAFRQEGAFPPIYTTSLMAGEKSGSLPEVLDRFVQYQKVTLAVRKKVLVSLIYPTVLIVLVMALILFLVTYVVPEFAALYDSMDADLPRPTQILVAFGVTFSENLLTVTAAGAAIVALLMWWGRTESARGVIDAIRMRAPIFGPIWVKYQVSQMCRLLSTLLQGGIPLMGALETTGASLGSRVMRDAVEEARSKVKEGRALSKSLAETEVFPPLAIEMIYVGESTGALPAMLNSVAEFFDEDVSNAMTAALSLIEPAIMIFMGVFVAFVLISLYLPIFSLAGNI
ncbi:MAG: type II secretion system F family protein [Bryobacterales bacterium]|nr:type II secretion system F family protein [Acidobacteriota bacterium]MCB9384844.1 type II secretion system F family protein [Bryobacterales bacterium]